MSRFFVMVFVALVSIFAMGATARAELFITVDISQQRMYVETPTDEYVWKISTARKGYVTPIGLYQPYLLKTMHYSSKYENAPMPNSIFFHGGYAIHATYDVKNLGRPASHGCVRLSPQNAKWLFRLVGEYGKENTFIEVIQ